MNPLVSCIVPVYNGAAHLAEAIDSILTQSHRPIEILVVDDGSTDASPEIAEELGEPVRCIRQANAGPVTARNRGIEESMGIFIGFLDSDDLWAPDKLALQLACFEEDESLDFCVGHVQNFWEAEMAHEARRFEEHRRSRPIPGYASQALLARRALFDRIGLFDAKRLHSDDTEWFLRARAAGANERLLQQVLVHRRLHGANRSRQMASSSLDEYLGLLKAQMDARRRQGDPNPAL